MMQVYVLMGLAGGANLVVLLKISFTTLAPLSGGHV